MHRPADQIVHHPLRARQTRGAVVPEEQCIGLEREIAVGDRDAQPFFCRPARDDRCDAQSAADRAVAASGRRRRRAPWEPAIRQALPRIDVGQRLRPAGERVDEKVRRLRRARKKLTCVTDRRQISAGPEAPDPRRRNERCVRAIDAPAALRWHDQIVGRPEKLIEARVDQPREHRIVGW